MKRVTAVRKVFYDRREYSPGESFDCDDEMHARILDTLGDVKINDDPMPSPAPIAPSSSQPAEPPKADAGFMSTDDAEPVTAPKRKRYQRRDMRADDLD
jgi:hypothetical protein